jgi:hypothetical protein
MAVGGIGTFATFILMIYDLRSKTKQLNTIQKIQSHQIEALYEPDIRISSWTGKSTGLIPNEIVIKNHGQDLLILEIEESKENTILNKEGMKNWFPRYINKDNEMHIPLLSHLQNVSSHVIIIKTRNRLGSIYESEINIVKGTPTIIIPPKRYSHV